MIENWKTYRLEEAVDRIIDYRGKTPQKTTRGIPLITAKIIKDGRINPPDEFIAEEMYESWMTRGIPQIDDVVLTTEAPLGEVAQIKTNEKIALAQRIITLRGKKDVIDSTFLKYFFQSPIGQGNLKAKESGSTVTGIKQSELRQVEIYAPDVTEQRRIASVLSALDDKIELNLQMNATLEAIAQAIFKRWFIDFQFPGFDGEVVDGLPKGWKRDALNGVLEELETGSRPKGGVKDIFSGIPSIGAESITRIGEFDFSKTRFVSDEYFERMKKGIVRHLDILIYKDGGRPGNFIPHVSLVGYGFPFEICCINEHVYRLQARDSLLQLYLYFWLNTENCMKEMTEKGTGVAIPGLNSTALKSVNVLIPNKSVLEVFNNLVQPIVQKILTNSLQSHKLSLIRDKLLPKLMSGKIPVTE